MKSNGKYLNRLSLAQILAFLLSLGSVSCQSIQGIYLSGTDFDKNILSLQRMKDKKCKLHLNGKKHFVKVRYCDSTYVFNKDSIFGYRDAEGNNFRLYNNGLYSVLNQGEQILIYKTERNEGGPKSPDIHISYFFSKDVSSPILPLTERNLIACFQDNKIFLEYLEIHFSNDSQLIEYDNIHKMYKINRLLQLSNKPKND